MNKILELINRAFPPDKAKHFIVGTLAAALGVILSTLLPNSDPMAGAMAASFCVGWFKEMGDAYANHVARTAGEKEPHEVSGADLWYTIAGCAPVVLALLVVKS